MTQGKTSAQITLNFVSSYDAYGGTGFHYLAQGQLTRPVYGVFTHTDPISGPTRLTRQGRSPLEPGR